jgi:hypothetical protein
MSLMAIRFPWIAVFWLMPLCSAILFLLGDKPLQQSLKMALCSWGLIFIYTLYVCCKLFLETSAMGSYEWQGFFELSPVSFMGLNVLNFLFFYNGLFYTLIFPLVFILCQGLFLYSFFVTDWFSFWISQILIFFIFANFLKANLCTQRQRFCFFFLEILANACMIFALWGIEKSFGSFLINPLIRSFVPWYLLVLMCLGVCLRSAFWFSFCRPLSYSFPSFIFVYYYTFLIFNIMRFFHFTDFFIFWIKERLI